ncbi:DUF2254 family protein [Halorubrum distributum]|nr:DUF2254 family protein [Halorubrum terrestre]
MRNETFHKLRYPLVVALLIFPVYAYFLNMDLSAVGTSIFSTLAGIQATIFAIVFSVVILGVQLSTSQYSPRLPDLFRSDTVYLRTVGVFAVSIGTSLLGLFAYGYVDGFWIELWLYSSGLLAIVAFVSLFDFVDRTLEQSTPEGILDRLEDDLTASQIIDQAEASSDDYREPDPFLVILSVINSQINERDAAAVYLGLDIISRRVSELLAECSVEMLEEDAPVGDSLEDLCTNRLTSTGETAVSAELEEGATEVVSALETIGRAGVDKSLERPVLLPVRGLSDLVLDLGHDGIDERVRGEAIESAKDMLQNAAEAGLWNGTGKATRYLGWQLANSVHVRDENQNYDRRYTSAVINYFPGILRKLVDSTADTIDDDTTNWSSPHPGGAHDSYSEARALQAVYISVAELTGAFLRYELRTGVNFPDWGHVGYGWVKAVSELSDSGLDSFKQQWIGTTLYLQYLSNETPDDVMVDFSPVLRREVSSNEIIAVIEQLLAEEIKPTQWLNFRQTMDPVEIPQTGYQYTLDIDTDESFEDWLSHRQDVLAASMGSGFVDRSGFAERLQEETESTEQDPAEDEDSE